MKLNLTAFKKYKKIISQILVEGNEELFLDLENQYAYFFKNNFLGRMKFEIETEEEIFTEGFYVKIKTFLPLCDHYESLILDKDLTFRFEEETFNIPVREAREDVDDFVFSEYEETIRLTAQDCQAIVDASNFVDFANPEFFTIELNKDTITAGDQTQIFSTVNSIALPEKISFNETTIKVIRTVKGLDAIDLGIAEKNLYLNIGEGDLELEIANYLNSSLPDMQDKEFKEEYDHKTFFVFEKQEMVEILRFLSPYTSGLLNEQILLTMENEESLKIQIEDEVKIVRVIALKEISEQLIGGELWTSKHLLQKAVLQIEDEFIKIQLDSAKDPEGNYIRGAFNVVGETITTKNIMTVRLD